MNLKILANIIQNLDNLINTQIYVNDFSTFGSAISILFSMMSMDLYPQCMIPAAYSSVWYIPFFVIFVILFNFVFIPLPIAAIYSSYKVFKF